MTGLIQDCSPTPFSPGQKLTPSADGLFEGALYQAFWNFAPVASTDCPMLT